MGVKFSKEEWTVGPLLRAKSDTQHVSAVGRETSKSRLTNLNTGVLQLPVKVLNKRSH